MQALGLGPDCFSSGDVGTFVHINIAEGVIRHGTPPGYYLGYMVRVLCNFVQFARVAPIIAKYF